MYAGKRCNVVCFFCFKDILERLKKYLHAGKRAKHSHWKNQGMWHFPQ